MASLGNTDKYYGVGAHRQLTLSVPTASGAAISTRFGNLYNRRYSAGTDRCGTDMGTFMARGCSRGTNMQVDVALSTITVQRLAGPQAAFSSFGVEQNTAGSITGTVTELGVGVPYAMVHLFMRKTGVWIASARADASGAYGFLGLDATITAQDGYLGVAIDPATGATYDALAHDRLTP